jgi:hypothetical protein
VIAGLVLAGLLAVGLDALILRRKRGEAEPVAERQSDESGNGHRAGHARKLTTRVAVISDPTSTADSRTESGVVGEVIPDDATADDAKGRTASLRS